MPFRHLLPRGLAAVALLAALLALAGCSTPPRTRAFFQDATINEKPAHVALDTGSDITTLTQLGAQKLDVRIPSNLPASTINGQQDEDALALSDPVSVYLGNAVFTAQLPIITSASYKRDAVDNFSTDALVGWPEMQDNILFFDGANRTISSLPEVPPEALAWSHYRLHPNSRLFLEIPLPNGSLGTVLIDTGQPSGVSLPVDQWRTWFNAHANTPTVVRDYSLPGEAPLMQNGVEAWADTITLGTLTLTDVPIHPAQTLETVGADHYLGTLGLYAITRLNLIIDTKNRVAYLQFLPAPGQPYSGFSRAAAPAPAHDAWLVTPSVGIKLEYIYIQAGVLQYNNGEYADSLANLNRALDLNAHNLDALYTRILVNTALGHAAESIEDCDALLANNPNYAAAYLQRAIARQIQGDYIGAIDDYDKVVLLLGSRPAPYATLNRYLLADQLGMDNVNLSALSATWHDPWAKVVAQFLLGHLSESSLLAAADGSSPDQADRKATALYFAGAVAQLHNNPSSAHQFWLQCTNLSLKGFNEYQAFAQAGLNHIENAAPAK